MGENQLSSQDLWAILWKNEWIKEWMNECKKFIAEGP